MVSILEICQEVADICAIQQPTDLFSTDQHNSIFLSVAKAELNSLMRYGDWQDLTKEATLRTTCGRTDYPIANIVSDFYSILNNTIYIKDQEKIIGAITAEEWAKQRYFSSTSASVQFKIQNDCIKFLKPPPDGLKIVFQYRSNAVCIDKDTSEEKSTITKNTDIPIFDRYVVQLGITWRFLKRNGMDYTEEYNEYQKELKKRYGSGLAKKDIQLAGAFDDLDGDLANVITTGSTCNCI